MSQETNTTVQAPEQIIIKKAVILSVGQYEAGKSTVKVSIKHPLEGQPSIKGYVSARTEADLDFIEKLEDANLNNETYAITLNESTFADSETGDDITLTFINPYSPAVEDLTKEQLAEMRAARRAAFKTAAKKAPSATLQANIDKANARLEETA